MFLFSLSLSSTTRRRFSDGQGGRASLRKTHVTAIASKSPLQQGLYTPGCVTTKTRRLSVCPRQGRDSQGCNGQGFDGRGPLGGWRRGWDSWLLILRLQRPKFGWISLGPGLLWGLILCVLLCSRGISLGRGTWARLSGRRDVAVGARGDAEIPLKAPFSIWSSKNIGMDLASGPTLLLAVSNQGPTVPHTFAVGELDTSQKLPSA